jgi:hypothetical protein
LSSFFKDAILGEEYPFLGSTCFDILGEPDKKKLPFLVQKINDQYSSLDAMNITQKIWGEDYNCGRYVTAVF